MPDAIRQIDCLEAVRQLWDYLDQELTDDRMAEVRQHLEQCERCLPHHDFGRLFLEALHAGRNRKLMPAVARLHVLSALAQAGFTPP
jgi:anti-sigma factor (TIGR02949 family)